MFQMGQQVFWLDWRAAPEHQMFDQVAQFAHVARPGVVFEHVARGR